jgi:glutathione S-transferase
VSSPPAERAPHLVHFRISHYSEKIRWALDFKGWPHTREALVPGFHIPRVRGLSGQNQVPVLVLGGEPITGSGRILEALEAQRPDPPLFPEDPGARRRAQELMAFFDDKVGPATRRLFWAAHLTSHAACARMATSGASDGARRLYRLALPLLSPLLRRNMTITAEAVAAARERLAGFADRIEAEVGPSGYLVGDRFGAADLTAAALMTPVLLPPELTHPIPEPWPPALVELRASIAERPGSKWVLDVYRRHRGRSAEIAAR